MIRSKLGLIQLRAISRGSDFGFSCRSDPEMGHLQPDLQPSQGPDFWQELPKHLYPPEFAVIQCSRELPLFANIFAK